MSPFTLVLAACLFIISWILIRIKKNKKDWSRLPPGPKGIPLLGNLTQVGPRLHLQLQAWAQEYGSIFSIQLGLEKIVVLDDHKLMKEMFNDPAFSGRPQNVVFTGLSEGSFGVINTEGKTWEAQRRFTLRHLRDFGFGKNYMENLILDEVTEVLNWLKGEEVAGRPVTLDRKLSMSVLNALWTISSGKRFSHDDPTLTHMLDRTFKAFNALSESGLLLFAPWARFLAPGLTGWSAFQKGVDCMTAFYRKTVQEHFNTYSGDHIRDFVDHYLQEIKSTTDSTSSFHGATGTRHLTAIVGDLFAAGAETTSNTLAWAVLYLSSHPGVQEKLHEEIDRVIGNSRLPSLQDRAMMPYTESIIFEVLRFSSLVPTGVFHRALATKEFHGYIIPKGTWIIPNLWSVHNNPEIWGDPENFRPERFLSSDGTTAERPEALIPFQLGKRVCLGEPLAKDTLFLFLTSIFQRFQVFPDPENPKADFEPKIGFLLEPKPFFVAMKDRSG